MLQLFSYYAYILCLDHPLPTLLADSYSGISVVSRFLATHAPISNTRYCSGRRF